MLPALALASFFVAVYARLVRASMLEVQRQDFMRTAHAKGLHPLLIQLRHALRNALIPVTTVAGIHLGNLLGGAVVVETLFGWPGMGRLALEAVLGRDFLRYDPSYDFIMAGLSSSAFPSVFAPRTESDVVPGRGKSDVYFADGGMFDNLPFMPAIEILREVQCSDRTGNWPAGYDPTEHDIEKILDKLEPVSSKTLSSN